MCVCSSVCTLRDRGKGGDSVYLLFSMAVLFVGLFIYTLHSLVLGFRDGDLSLRCLFCFVCVLFMYFVVYIFVSQSVLRCSLFLLLRVSAFVFFSLFLCLSIPASAGAALGDPQP